MISQKFTKIDQLATITDGNMADIYGVLNTNLHDLDDSYGFVLTDPDTKHEAEVFVNKIHPIPLLAYGDAVLLYNVIISNNIAHYCQFTKTVSLYTCSEVRAVNHEKLNQLDEVEFLESMMAQQGRITDTAQTDSTIKDILRLLKVDCRTMTAPTWTNPLLKSLRYIPIIHLVHGRFDLNSRFRIYGQILSVAAPRFYISRQDGLKHAKCRVQVGDDCGGKLTVTFKDGQETELTGVDVAHSSDRKKRIMDAVQSLKGEWIHIGVEIRQSKVLSVGVQFT